MRCLELFCGSKSIGKCFEKNGWEVVSVDIDSKFEPTIVANILTKNVDFFGEPGSYHYIHASPPCTEFSQAKTTGVRNLELADRIVKHTLHIIRFLQPMWYSLENPQSGLLKNRDYMKDLKFKDCSYCRYSTPYKKTRDFGPI